MEIQFGIKGGLGTRGAAFFLQVLIQRCRNMIQDDLYDL